VPFRATLFDKAAASNWLVAWHQDTALPLTQRVDDSAWGPWSVKRGVLHAIAPVWALAAVIALRVHLDDSTEDNGPLRVLPGTHAGGVLSHDEVQRLANTVTPITCVRRQVPSSRCVRWSFTPHPRRARNGLVASFTSSMRHRFISARASSWPLANKHLQPSPAGATMSRRD
jgi:hypothetical protein